MTRVRDSIFVALHRWFLPSSHVTTRAELCTPRKIANLWLFTVFAELCLVADTNFQMNTLMLTLIPQFMNVELFQNQIEHIHGETG